MTVSFEANSHPLSRLPALHSLLDALVDETGVDAPVGLTAPAPIREIAKAERGDQTVNVVAQAALLTELQVRAYVGNSGLVGGAARLEAARRLSRLTLWTFVWLGPQHARVTFETSIPVSGGGLTGTISLSVQGIFGVDQSRLP